MAVIAIQGIDELIRKLGTVAAMDTLIPPMERAQNRLWRRAASYTQSNPRKPVNSRYERRFILAKGWTVKPVERLTNGVQGVIGNDIEYAPLVKSSRHQSMIHRGRWPTIEDDIEAERQTIIQDFERAIRTAIEE